MRQSSAPIPLRPLSLAILLLAHGAQAAETTRVSLGPGGIQASDASEFPGISADGRFVAFTSSANNLDAGDTNNNSDVFVRDRLSGTITRISVASNGTQGDLFSEFPSISADGRFVAFHSYATNLAAGCTYGYNVFVRDRIAGTTACVSVTSSGAQGNGGSRYPSISADGRFVAFVSGASNLVAGDTNYYEDIFVRDRLAGTTTRVNVASSGEQANSWSAFPRISADGRFIAFESLARNLASGDTNGTIDVFVRDRAAKTTERISIASDGTQGNGISDSARISADGRFVAFESRATNLAAGCSYNHNSVVRNRVAGTTECVALSWSSAKPDISADGRFLALESDGQVLIRDRIAGSTTRASVDSGGLQGNADSSRPSISADGRFVGFHSLADNLTAGDTNDAKDVFVRDQALQKARQADMQLTVTSQPASVPKGQNAHYVFTVKNAGPAKADAVNLIDVVSQGAPVTLTPSQGQCTRAVVSVCRLGAVAAGASITLNVVIRAGAQALRQQLSVNAAPRDDKPGNNYKALTTPVAL